LTVLAAALILLTALLDAHSGYHAGVLDAWNGATLRPMLRCLAGFMLGITLWRLRQWAPASRFASAPASLATVLLTLAAALACDAPDLLIYPLFPALVFCLAAGQSRAAAPLATGPAIWLGDISYALYLLHIFLLHPLDVTRAAARLALPVPVAEIVAPATIFTFLLAASHLAWRHIEMPGRRLMMSLADGPQPVHSVQLTPLR
jgi:peptidoglycan/LPS O-acetylase OafA/YrhL